MPVDPEIALKFSPAVPGQGAVAPMNPLQMMGQIGQIQAQQNQNMLFEQNFAAQAAMGDIARRSVDPQTGQVDYTKMATGLAMNPLTSYKAVEFIKQIAERDKLQAEGIKLKLEGERLKMEGIADVARGLLSKAPSGAMPLDDLTDAVADLRGRGIIDDAGVLKLAAKFNQPDQVLRDNLRRMVATSTRGKEGLDFVFGELRDVDVGPGIVTERRVPGLPPQEVQRRVKGLTPAEGLRPVDVRGPGGATFARPQAAVTGETLSGLAPGTVTGGARSNQLQAMGGDITQLAPYGGEAPAQPQGGALAPAIAQMPAPTVVPRQASVDPLKSPLGYKTGLGPEEQEAGKARGVTGAKYIEKLSENANVSMTMLQRITEMDRLLENIQTMPGMTTRRHVAELMRAIDAPEGATNTILGKTDKGDTLAYLQAFNKTRMQATMEDLRQALGGQGRITQMEFSAFLDAMPNEAMTKEAIKVVFDIASRVAKLRTEEFSEAKKWEASGKSLADFQSNWDKYLIDSGRITPITRAVDYFKGAKSNAR